tara:strand:- start:128 stop:1762 length:1635 start_codon:yes stop_codon:yes gene_type:complete
MSLRPKTTAPVGVADTTNRLSKVLFIGLDTGAKTHTEFHKKAAKREEGIAHPMWKCPTPTTLLPEDSGLSLLIPKQTQNQADYQLQLMGHQTINNIFELMTNGKTVVCSGPGGYALTSVSASGASGASVVFNAFDAFGLSSSRGRMIGAGSFNTSYRVEAANVPQDITELYKKHSKFKNGLPSMIFRQSNGTADVKARDAISELIITGFAAQHHLGPELIAAYIVPLFTVSDLTADIDNSIVKLCCFSEAWSGDLSIPLREKKFTPREFAYQFANLLEKSWEHGLWHLDAKPPNMLWRRDTLGVLELCWTDFDNYWCSLWSPNMSSHNDNCNRCMVLVHSALVMGYMSCVMGREVYDFYLPMVELEIEKRFKISTVTDTTVCDWLDQMSRADGETTHTPMRGDDGEMAAKLKISYVLRSSLNNYVTSGGAGRGGDSRCILREILESASIKQFFDFAIRKAGQPEIERWSGLRVFKRRDDLFMNSSSSEEESSSDEEEDEEVVVRKAELRKISRVAQLKRGDGDPEDKAYGGVFMQNGGMHPPPA